MIRLKNFSLKYRKSDERALDSIDLQVKKGEFVVIIGPTGCGKTSLLRSLAGLIQPEQTEEFSGIAEIRGLPLRKINNGDGPGHVGILFQNPDDQITGWTAREEVMFGLENIGLSDEDINQRVLDSLELADLVKKADEPIETLSGGQKQRVVSAAVVAMEPDLILLDEPTSNLDWRSRARLVEYLKKLKEKKLTLIVATHEPDDFLPVSDRIISMDEGRFVENNDQIKKDQFEELNSVFGDSGAVRSIDGHSRQQLISLEEVVTSFKKSNFKLGPISADFCRGEIVSLFGPNGGGKSTFLQLLAGLLKPFSGQLHMSGKRLNSKEKKTLYRRIAYVPQNPDLTLHSSTVQKELSARIRYLNLDTNKRFDLANILIMFNLRGLESRHPFSLSQGQRQRLAVAAAISGGVELLLIDEPTTGQDPRQISFLLEILKKLSNEGITVILSTHNLRAAQNIADRALFIKDGKIVRDGPADLLLHDQNLLEDTMLTV